MPVNGLPELRRLAVLGHPVSHSRSPVMQNAALADLGLDRSWAYEAIDVGPDEFEARVRSLPAEGFAGVNVTVPHKQAALAVADSASDASIAIGAANTLSFNDGRIHAENTDGPGLIDAITDVPAAMLQGARGLVLGAGGAARAVIWSLAQTGVEVSIWNRTAAKAETLAAEFEVSAVGQPSTGDFEVIVNASAAGLGGDDALADLPFDASGFRPGQTVVDMVYGETPSTLLEAARSAGAETIDGLEILVRQGARSLEIWTGEEPSLEVMRLAARG